MILVSYVRITIFKIAKIKSFIVQSNLHGRSLWRCCRAWFTLLRVNVWWIGIWWTVRTYTTLVVRSFSVEFSSKIRVQLCRVGVWWLAPVVRLLTLVVLLLVLVVQLLVPPVVLLLATMVLLLALELGLQLLELGLQLHGLFLQLLELGLQLLELGLQLLDLGLQLYILPLENIQDFLRFTSMKWISQEPIYFYSVIPRGLDHDPYICTTSCFEANQWIIRNLQICANSLAFPCSPLTQPFSTLWFIGSPCAPLALKKKWN